MSLRRMSISCVILNLQFDTKTWTQSKYMIIIITHRAGPSRRSGGNISEHTKLINQGSSTIINMDHNIMFAAYRGPFILILALPNKTYKTQIIKSVGTEDSFTDYNNPRFIHTETIIKKKCL